MRLRSFGPWSPRLERLSDTPRDLVDHGGFLVEHSQLFVRQRRRCAALGLDVGDRLTHLARPPEPRSEEHTSELQSQSNLVCRLLLEKKKKPVIIVSASVC